MTAHEEELESRKLNRKRASRSDARVIARKVGMKSAKLALRVNGQVTACEVEMVSRKVKVKRMSRDDGQVSAHKMEMESRSLKLKGTSRSIDQIAEKKREKRKKGLENSVFLAFCCYNNAAIRP